MFEKILVTAALYPAREAAGKGNLDAMFDLLTHVIEGRHTRQCGDTAFEIITVMFDHPDFSQNLPRAWAVYVLCSHAEQLLYRAGKNTRREMIERSCDYLQWVVEAMLCAPRRMWNYEQLAYAVGWISEHAPQLQEEPAS